MTNMHEGEEADCDANFGSCIGVNFWRDWGLVLELLGCRKFCTAANRLIH